MRTVSSIILAALLTAAPVASQAGNSEETVIGVILGGATGAIIGRNLGGRDGAIVGGAIGAAAGATIANDRNRNDGYEDDRRYQSARQDRRYDDRYDQRYDRRGDDRYDRRYDDRYDDRYDQQREVVVVESPRYYYQGNDFVYGVPPGYGRGHHHGRGHQRQSELFIVQQAPRYQGEYCPPPRRW